jgi:hypothetical protein
VEFQEEHVRIVRDDVGAKLVSLNIANPFVPQAGDIPDTASETDFPSPDLDQDEDGGEVEAQDQASLARVPVQTFAGPTPTGVDVNQYSEWITERSPHRKKKNCRRCRQCGFDKNFPKWRQYHEGATYHRDTGEWKKCNQVCKTPKEECITGFPVPVGKRLPGRTGSAC